MVEETGGVCRYQVLQTVTDVPPSVHLIMILAPTEPRFGCGSTPTWLSCYRPTAQSTSGCAWQPNSLKRTHAAESPCTWCRLYRRRLPRIHDQRSSGVEVRTLVSSARVERRASKEVRMPYPPHKLELAPVLRHDGGRRWRGHRRSACSSGALAVRLRRRRAALLLTPHVNFQRGSTGVTAAYQIEGAVAADGRVDSIWDTFQPYAPGIRRRIMIRAMACDHYHRWERH